jgi:hypothetical protein
MMENNNKNLWEMVKNDSSMSEGDGTDGTEQPRSTSTSTPSAPEAPPLVGVDIGYSNQHSCGGAGISEDLLSLTHYKVDDCDNVQQDKITSIVIEKDMSSPNNMEQDDVNEVNVGASVAAGAVAGLLLGGPFLSLVAAAGAGVYVKKEGPAADVVRAGGEIALAVRDSATRLNEKHDLVNKAKEATSEARRKFCEYDNEHHVWQKLREFLYMVGTKAVELERKHHLLENMLSCVARGAARLADKLTTEHGAENPPPTAPVSTAVPMARVTLE